VDRACEEFFAGSGLALDQYRQIPLSQSLRHRDYALHCTAAIDDAAELRRSRGQSLHKVRKRLICLIACNRKKLSGQIEWNDDRTHTVLTR